VELPKLRFLRLEGIANIQGRASLPITRLERKLGRVPDEVLDKIKQALIFALDIG
jgi:mRNA interferase MazF